MLARVPTWLVVVVIVLVVFFVLNATGIVKIHGTSGF
jgi:hypothetical protein